MVPMTEPAHPGQTHVFHRTPKVTMPAAAGGEGPYLFDTEGKRYLDASSGAAVSSLGHGHPRVTAAIKRQLDQLAFAHTSFFTSPVAEELADYLAAAAPGALEKTYFLSGGSEAVEAALKLARQYFVEIGQPQRSRIISRQQSYHGNTLGALAAGGNLWRRANFAPLLVDVSHVPACYPYRDKRPDETEAAYGRRIADALEAAILAAGPETVMCFIAETVGGATLGAVPPVEGYFKRIREICDRYGVLLILDEVMCGMGRTGTLFAYEQEGIEPDILALAKGLGAGYQPIGAMMTTARIYDAVVAGSGFFQHGHTYTGHIAACAGALAVQQVIRDEDLLANVRRRGTELMDSLTERFGNHPNIGDIRGRGLFQALEFVQDRATKAPLDPRRRFAARLKSVALDEGLLCYPMGGLVDGTAGDHVMLAPPFIIDERHVEEITDKLHRSVARVLAETA
jgi:adenosylmethionine-8-amino-7-oxononanoate aminotransferase